MVLPIDIFVTLCGGVLVSGELSMSSKVIPFLVTTSKEKRNFLERNFIDYCSRTFYKTQEDSFKRDGRVLSANGSLLVDNKAHHLSNETLLPLLKYSSKGSKYFELYFKGELNVVCLVRDLKTKKVYLTTREKHLLVRSPDMPI